MINFVICDDEKHIRDKLESYIKEYGKSRFEEVSINAFSSGGDLMMHYPVNADIILLDIKMGTPDGLETARIIRNIAPNVCIIFITSMNNYALRGYEVKAFGFLIKPVPYDVFCNEIDMALIQRSKQGHHFILIRDRSGQELHQIDTNDICYVEVKNHDLYYVLDKSSIACRGSIKDAERNLKPFGFFRCHASFLVNQRYISSIGESLILSSGTEIPISKGRKKDFISDLTNYVGALIK